MTAINMCSNFGGKWCSPPLKASMFIMMTIPTNLVVNYAKVRLIKFLLLGN